MRLRHIEVFHAIMQAGTISGAAQLLQKALEDKGLTFMLNAQTAEIVGTCLLYTSPSPRD